MYKAHAPRIPSHRRTMAPALRRAYGLLFLFFVMALGGAVAGAYLNDKVLMIWLAIPGLVCIVGLCMSMRAREAQDPYAYKPVVTRTRSTYR